MSMNRTGAQNAKMRTGAIRSALTSRSPSSASFSSEVTSLSSPLDAGRLRFLLRARRAMQTAHRCDQERT